ncbi:hypothetical protein [Novosphingobium resinovorum]|uniref:hypothetical protein n=1 Tax=Novosphingobium resinovorum TaxID=158500 RepID=UPI002ED46C4F|nr:hypothetical protein [Novosphingobium resinovorum]
MAKVVAAVAVVVAIAAAIPTGGGSTLLAAGLSSVAGTAVSAATAGMIAAGVGLASTALTMLTAKAPAIDGGQTQWQSDPNTDAKIWFGRTGGSGDVCYRKTAGGSKNKQQYIYTDISTCGPVHMLEKTMVDKASVTFNASGDIIGRLTGNVYQAHQRGLCPEATALRSLQPGTPPGWTSAHKTSGHAAVMNCFVFDGKGDKTFTQIPDMLWVWHGVMCYDPRKDSTYPGGSGAHRFDDQTTWEISYNGWVQAITYALGWFQGPNVMRVGGVGMPITSIDLAAFVEAANVADANGWKSGGRISTGDDKWESMKALCQAGGGEPVRLGATLSCIVNTPRVPIGTITRDDVIGNASSTTTQTRRDRINGIIPTYRSEDHYWEQVPAGVVRNSNYLAQDGGIERTKSVTYPMIQCDAGENPDQVAQIAGYDIANAREAGPAVWPMKLRWLGYKAGDCLSIENAPEFGYFAGKDVLVLKRQLDPESGGVVLTFRTETAAKHPYALNLTGTPAPTTDAASTPPEAEAPEAGTWAAATRVDTIAGRPVGVIAITGSVEDDTATQVTIEYRETGSAIWLQAASLSIDATSYEITGLDVSKSYDVAVSYFSELRLEFPGLTFSYTPAAPTASGVTADTSANPPTITWQMPEITGWSYARVARGTSSDPDASVVVSDPITGGLFEERAYEDETLAAGTYWWWVRIYDAGGAVLSTSAATTGTVV